MPATGANPQDISMDFDALRLNPGAVMQIKLLSEGLPARHEVRFIGHIKNQSVLVTLPVQDGKGVWMQAEQTYVIRGFNGIHAYAFKSQVIRPRAHPFHYVHFSWPRTVECQLVRHSLRVGIQSQANLILPDGTSLSATMLDLSLSGSMLATPTEFGAVGDRLKIGFALNVEDRAVELNLSSVIRNVNLQEDGKSYRIGLAFEQVSHNDGLILHYYTNTQAQKSL